jgi:hypothetical protein
LKFTGSVIFVNFYMLYLRRHVFKNWIENSEFIFQNCCWPDFWI